MTSDKFVFWLLRGSQMFWFCPINNWVPQVPSSRRSGRQRCTLVPPAIRLRSCAMHPYSSRSSSCSAWLCDKQASTTSDVVPSPCWRSVAPGSATPCRTLPSWKGFAQDCARCSLCVDRCKTRPGLAASATCQLHSCSAACTYPRAAGRCHSEHHAQ